MARRFTRPWPTRLPARDFSYSCSLSILICNLAFWYCKCEHERSALWRIREASQKLNIHFRLGSLNSPPDPQYPQAEAVMGYYKDEYPLTQNGHHVYRQEGGDHMLMYLQSASQGTIGWAFVNSEHVVAIYRPRDDFLKVWQGAAVAEDMFMQGSWYFLFESGERKVKVLCEYSDEDAEDAINTLHLRTHTVRSLRKTGHFLGAVIGGDVVLNMQTLGYVAIQTMFKNDQSAHSCFGPGWHQSLCCRPMDARTGSSKYCWYDPDPDVDRFLHNMAIACCEKYSYDSYEIPFVDVPPLVSSEGLFEQETHRRVDIIVRGYYGDRDILLLTLDSIAVFWPFHTWDSCVFLVVDEGEENRKLCETIPHRFVQCIYIPVVAFSSRSYNICFDRLLADEFILSTGREPDWIVHFDSDVVLHTFHIPELLFPFGKPVWFGSRRWSFPLNPLILGMDWVAEFTDSFPFVVHSTHLREVRRFIQAQMEADSYESAFRRFADLLIVNTKQSAVYRAYEWESCTEIGILGSYLYYFFRENYTWALEDGALYGLPPEHSCLALRIGTHMHDLKHGARHCEVGLPDGLPAGDEYSCREYKDKKGELYRQAAQNIITKGLRKEGMETLLLSPDNSIENMWKPVAAAHCPNRAVAATLEAYYKLQHTYLRGGHASNARFL